MAIRPEDYLLRPGETTDQYNQRISGLRSETPPSSGSLDTPLSTGRTTRQVLEESTRVAQDAARVAGLSYTPPSSITSSALAPAPTPSVPEPTAPTLNQAFTTSLSEQLETQRKSLEDSYKRQIEDLQRQRQDAERRMKVIEAQQEDVLTQDVQPLLQPFREQLETSERQRLFVDENFEANQKLVRELDTLLTEGNNLIRGVRGSAGPASIMNARLARTIEDVNARAGVINATLAARNGQISQAFTMIDRSVQAITADKQDRLNYFTSLFNFYETQKDEEGKKVVDLTKEERGVFEKQIKLLENDLSNAQTYAENIKKAMADPDKALAYASAGVALNDSPEAINTKLASYAYSKEVADLANTMAKQGYTYVVPGQAIPSGAEVVTTTDSQGNTKRYYKLSKDKVGGVVDVAALDITSPTYFEDLITSSAGGKKPNQVETLRPLQKAVTVMSQLGELSSLIKNTKTDPIIGTLRSMNPYDFDARAIQATLQATVPNLARGVYGEVGVLTDNDIRNYIKTLPNIQSTEAQNKFVMGMSLRSLQRGFESQLEVLAAAGYDISGFGNIYERMKTSADKIESELGIGGEITEDTIKREFETLNSGGSLGAVNFFAPIENFFSEFSKALFR